MRPQMGRQALRVAAAIIFLIGCGSVVLLHAVETEREERLLHLPGAVILVGYLGDDVLYVSRNGEELTLQPPGPNRAGHHTYPRLSRDATFVATSYVKSRH